jgi:hypothetical protein
MATAVGLNMKITADTAGIGRGMTRTERLLQGVDRNAQSAARSLRAIATVQIGGAVLKGLSSITGALTSAANSAVSYANSLRTSIDETAKLAARTGISVEALQGFQVAADLSGVQNLESAIQRLTISIGDAGAGVKGPQQALDKLGLSFDRISKLSPEDQFRAVAAAFEGVGSQAEKAAVAADLFGRSGVELLPLFDSNLAEIEARAQRLGIVLGRDQTAAIERMNDSLSLVRKTLDGILGQVLANIADVVTAITEEFLQFVEAFEGLDGAQGGNAIADVITKSVLNGIEGFLNVVRFVGNGFLTFADILSKIITKLAPFAGVDLRSDAQRQLDQLESRLSPAGPGGVPSAGADVLAEIERLQAQVAQELAEASSINLKQLFNNAIDAAVGAAEDVRTRLADRPPRAAAAAAAEAAVAAPNLLRAGLAAANNFVRQKSVLVKPFAELGKGLVGQFIDNANQQAERLKPILEGISQLEKQRAEKAEQIEENRLDALSRRSNQALTVGDIRSGGISEVLRIASGREDPAIEEYRRQLVELRKIDAKIGELRADKVKIIGGAGRAA